MKLKYKKEKHLWVATDQILWGMCEEESPYSDVVTYVWSPTHMSLSAFGLSSHMYVYGVFHET